MSEKERAWKEFLHDLDDYAMCGLSPDQYLAAGFDAAWEARKKVDEEIARNFEKEIVCPDEIAEAIEREE